MSKSNLVVEVEHRVETGSRECRRLRARGKVPGIVYGGGLDPYPISVAPRRIDEILHSDAGRNAILQLKLGGDNTSDTRAAMIRELVRDPVSGNSVHIDFVRVDLTKKLEVAVPIHVTGEPAGVKAGGVLELVQREINLECLPGDIPEHFDVDVSSLEIGDQIHVREITTPDTVTVLDDPEQVMVHVVPPHVIKEPSEEIEGEEAEAEEAAEEAAESESEARAEPESES